VSRTLEYAYDDWCIARFAEAIGKQDIADRFFVRSRNWQNLFDPNTGFFRARRNGGFVEPFDPYEVNFHFTEANAWQYGLFVPHDLEHYKRTIGGAAALTMGWFRPDLFRRLITYSGTFVDQQDDDVLRNLENNIQGE
jgi:putative alpha-1,2-mannosidase